MQRKSTVLYPALPSFVVSVYRTDGTLPLSPAKTTIFLAERPCTLFLSRGIVSLAQGEVLFIPAFTLCRALHGDGFYGYALTIPENLLTELNSALPYTLLAEGGRIPLAPADEVRITATMRVMMEEADANYTQLFSLLSVLENACSPLLESFEPLPRVLQRTLVYFSENTAQRTKPEALAARSEISKSTLCRYIRKYLDTTFSDLHLALRMLEAQKLLHLGISVETVCLRCGFTSKTALNAAMKKLYGISLKDFLSETK